MGAGATALDAARGMAFQRPRAPVPVGPDSVTDRS
ncbi:hypothetical protein EDE04_6779 [Streptomyces sp. 2132.2]|nr:hypothetical protein EDE04_6779 [Streptomyces sp. 2132.2]